MRSIRMILLLFLIAGCGESEPGAETVSLDKVPAPVMKVAKDKLRGIQFQQAWKTPNGNYEVRGKSKNGKVRDIQLKPNGTVVEID